MPNLAGFVPRFNSVGEAGLPAECAGRLVTKEAGAGSHGVLFLADMSEGWRACQPGVGPGFNAQAREGLDAGDNGLDPSASRLGATVRMASTRPADSGPASSAPPRT